MSIVETSEEGKDVVSQANDGTGQITGWEAVEVKTISEIFNCTQVYILPCNPLFFDVCF